MTARRGKSHRELHGRRAELAHVGAALFERAMSGGRALLAEREEEVGGARVLARRAARELTGPLDGAGDAVVRVVGRDARRLEQDLDVEPALLQEIGGAVRSGRDRSEQVARRRSLGASARELFGELAERYELRFVATRMGGGSVRSRHPLARGGRSVDRGGVPLQALAWRGAEGQQSRTAR